MMRTSNTQIQTIFSRGFTLIETMIALAIGAFILLGVFSVYSALRASTTETLSAGELLETGRLAMNIIQQDVERAGFWGANLDLPLDSNLIAVPNTFVGDCEQQDAYDNNRSFPNLASPYSFRYLYARTATSSSELGCITDAKTNSDVLQLKRVGGQALAGPASFQSNRFYLISNGVEAGIVSGQAGSFPVITDSESWTYMHRVYYVSSGDLTLKRKQLIVSGSGDARMDTVSLMNGIERMHVQLGIDVNGDQQVDMYIAPNSLTNVLWTPNDDNQIIAVKVYLLVRALRADPRYDNNNTYDMGGQVYAGNGDHYRRLLLAHTVRLENATTTPWYEGIR